MINVDDIQLLSPSLLEKSHSNLKSSASQYVISICVVNDLSLSGQDRSLTLTIVKSTSSTVTSSDVLYPNTSIYIHERLFESKSLFSDISDASCVAKRCNP